MDLTMVLVPLVGARAAGIARCIEPVHFYL